MSARLSDVDKLIAATQRADAFMRALEAKVKSPNFPDLSTNELCAVVGLSADDLAATMAIFMQAALGGNKSAAVAIYDIGRTLGLLLAATPRSNT